MIVYAVIDDTLSARSPLGDAIRHDEPELAEPLRIEERVLEAGGPN